MPFGRGGITRRRKQRSRSKGWRLSIQVGPIGWDGMFRSGRHPAARSKPNGVVPTDRSKLFCAIGIISGVAAQAIGTQSRKYAIRSDCGVAAPTSRLRPSSSRWTPAVYGKALWSAARRTEKQSGPRADAISAAHGERSRRWTWSSCDRRVGEASPFSSGRPNLRYADCWRRPRPIRSLPHIDAPSDRLVGRRGAAGVQEDAPAGAPTPVASSGRGPTAGAAGPGGNGVRA